MARELERLEKFAADVQQEVLAVAQEEGAEELTAHAFTRYMIEQVIAAGELMDGHQVYFRARGMEVSGYAVDEEETTLDLFATVYSGVGRPETVRRDAIDAALKRLRGFFDRASNGLHADLEQASPAHDLALRVAELHDRIDTLRLFVFTDGTVTIDYLPPEQDEQLRIMFSVWDLRRLQRFADSGREQEPIEIDFVERFGASIPCLDAGLEDDGAYRALLAVFPGSVLEEVYAQYGSRLLELNVRSFLSARGKVNKGIRETILHQPGRFLAYNNGISATASSIELITRPDGGTAIARVRDLQIVNGAQTTASLHHAVRRDRADLADVYVQAKITVVQPQQLGELVPLVSRYSNSQNKVSEADFSANDPFHVRVESLSRTTWAPATDGTQRQTRWFYERARGQYQDALSRAGTPARQRNFKIQHPTGQKFTKTDLAKYENTWAGLPHIVSKGAQKNFIEFTLRSKDRRKGEDAPNYFELLIARAIVFKRAEKIITEENFGGYRANIVAYTVAIIIRHRGAELDLPAIWRQQEIPNELADAIRTVSRPVNEVLTNAPGGGNVTEWAKKVECWDRMRDAIPASRVPRIAAGGTGPSASDVAAERRAMHADKRLVRVMGAVPAEAWEALQMWSRETGQMSVREREVAMYMSNAASHGRPPTLRYAERAREILSEAQRLGFRHSRSNGETA